VITVLVVGTATEVGKTWVGGQVLTRLRARGLRVAARKPVQSFDPDDVHPHDADVLAAATGEDVTTVCPAHRSYERAMAPPIAAMHLGRELGLLVDVVTDMAEPADDTDLLWVETVGGPRSPLADDGDSADLARWLHPDFVVLVADAGLGTINAVRLSAGPFAGRQLLVLLNRYAETDPIHRSNAAWLRDEGFSLSTDCDQLADFFAEIVAPAG
jgi:dethiobiotin synthetase